MFVVARFSNSSFLQFAFDEQLSALVKEKLNAVIYAISE